MVEVTRSKKYDKVGNELIKRIPSIRFIKDCKIRIAYLESTEKKKKSSGIVYADCRKVDNIYSPFCKYDFLITVYTENIIGLTYNQMLVVMYHELLHVGLDDTSLEPKYEVNPHDIEDFKEIVNKFGIDWNVKGNEIPIIWDVMTNESY